MIRWSCRMWLVAAGLLVLAHLWLPDSWGMSTSLFHAVVGWVHLPTALVMLVAWGVEAEWWLGTPSLLCWLWTVNPGMKNDVQQEWIVVSQNVNAWAAEPRAQAERWLTEEVDVLVVQELSMEFAARMEEWDARQRFPHRFAAPSTGPRGLGIYSRLPIQEADIDEESRWMWADIEGRKVYAVHTTAPFSAEHARMRNQQLSLLADRIQAESGPLLVVGDFNISPTSPAFRAFKSSTGLDDAIWRCGPMWSATWAMGSLPPVLRIDHVLTSEDLGCSDVEILPRWTSDHAPIRARIGVRDGSGGRDG